MDLPVARLLPDGRRLHLRDGPIDLIIGADGRQTEIAAAYAAAVACFEGLLAGLCSELPLLRSRAQPASPIPRGPVARRMHAAVTPFAGECFITPMAAVAGSVAEEILAAMTAATRIDRAFVNNGGDIAIHLEPEKRFRIGLVDRPDMPGLFGKTEIGAADPVRGVATSGWRGRSFSLGIADAVTVLAPVASMADAAATVIANAIDLPGHPGVTRVPARDIQPDTDLGDIAVTTAVAHLGPEEIDHALSRGHAEAERLCARGLIVGAALHLQGVTRIAGMPTMTAPTKRVAAYA